MLWYVVKCYLSKYIVLLRDILGGRICLSLCQWQANHLIKTGNRLINTYMKHSSMQLAVLLAINAPVSSLICEHQ